MQVNYTEDGEQFVADNGRTLDIYGEQRCGEVFVDGEFFAFYERDAQSKIVLYAEDDTVLAQFNVEGWEDYAASVLA